MTNVNILIVILVFSLCQNFNLRPPTKLRLTQKDFFLLMKTQKEIKIIIINLCDHISLRRNIGVCINLVEFLDYLKEKRKFSTNFSFSI